MTLTVFSPGERIRCLWNKYFPDIPLLDTRWFEKYDSKILQKALRIACNNDKQGRFVLRTAEDIGKYISATIRELRRRAREHRIGQMTLIVEVHAIYKITEKDKARFTAKLKSSGDCLLFNGASQTGGYGRFYVHGGNIGAHVFALFKETGYLPDRTEIDGFEVAHSCANRKCCNPDHLALKSKDVNLAERKHQKGDVIAVDSCTPFQPLDSPPLPILPDYTHGCAAPTGNELRTECGY